MASATPEVWSVFDLSNELILEIHFGEGGEDSKQFVNELFQAYAKYAQALNITCEILDASPGHVIAHLKGKGVGRAFRYETGKHVVQRVPRTERNGRKQTSVVSVGVLPVRPQREYHPLPEGDLEITAQRGSQKAGGQKVNKTSSAIRAKHIPTGLVVFIQNERSQAQNKEEAIRLLTARVNDMRQGNTDSRYNQHRKEVIGNGGRGDKVRTYNWMQSRVTDHRLNTQTTRIELVMRGQFGLILPK